MRKIETQSLGRHLRPFLFNLRPEHLSERIMKQVGGSMVIGNGLPAFPVNDSTEFRLRIFRGIWRNMQNQVVFLDGVSNRDFLSLGVFQVA